MASQLIAYSLKSPGFWGVNIQDSPVDLDPNFALRANNCVIDQSGRIAARKGWSKVSSANVDLGSNPIECIGELIQTDGTTTVLAAGGGFLFKLSSGTLTTLTYGGGGVAPTISANNWEFCQLNGIGMFWQRGYDPLIYDPAVSTSQFRRLSEKSGYIGTAYQCNTAISAYGRIWAADTTSDKQTVVWTDLLTPHIWTGGTAGSLDVRMVWPEGADEIVTMAAHNDFLYIFGKRQILIYKGAEDPATMQLEDAIATVGCIARDSVQNIGTDMIFLSHLGVQAISRVIQEKSAPLVELSRNVRDDMMQSITAETMANVKSVYSDVDAFYLLTFPTSVSIYCFDLRTKLEDGSARVTTWDSNIPKAFLSSASRRLYFGKPGYIGQYGTYLDDAASYRMAYTSPHIDFGDPVAISVLKKIKVTAVSLQQSAVVKWAFDFLQRFYAQSVIINPGTVNTALYNVSEYNTTAEYTTSVAATVADVNASGSGKTVQIAVEVQVSGYSLSLQKIDVYAKQGRLR